MENRELQIIKIVKAPIALLWTVWSNPEPLAHWWGPLGFTNTIHIMDFQIGGEWLMTMHGPDGTNFPNRSVFKDIVPSEKIVFEHFNPHFITTVLFEAKGHNTQINWTMLFDTTEMRDTIIKAHRADEGLKQNIEKLETYLSKRRGESSP